MKGASVLLLLATCAAWEAVAFLNNRPFPTYSLESMPNTRFSCREKILGGYYADPDTQCQMFHVCVKVAGVGVQDFRFLCPNGTAFDQDHQICADWEDVDCDATTLYYSSDNFDLYRIGSGFESKAVKYGEEEEPFALQRAETGDIRINREHQTQQVNQQNDNNGFYKARKTNNNNNNERDIFKGSSSSNFFNNRNNGKENDEDYDDNVNVNQNRDYEQKRKIVRKQNRRPVQQTRNDEDYNNQNNNQNNNNNNQNNNQNNHNNQYRGRNQNNNRYRDESDTQTSRPQRPTGFSNNFAGSSYIPTTSRPSTTNSEQFSTQNNNNRGRHIQRQRVTNQQQFNDFESSKQPSQNNSPTPTYTISTPAPFRQNNQQTTQNNGQYYTTTVATKKTENYPTTSAPLNFNTNYDVQKVKTKQTENYPSNNPQYAKQTTPFVNSQQYNAFDKKPTTLNKQTDYPTTFAPKPKPFSAPQKTQPPNPPSAFPTTFAPRTNAAYTQISQQTNNALNKNSNRPTTQINPSTFNQQFSSVTKSSTQRTTQYTQYTPTVPKITSTTPVSRSNRFDETQYDDGSYSAKYDYDGGDEFLKTAHSQNIASSRNELAKSTKLQEQQSTKYQQQSTKTQQESTQRPFNSETPRPFSVSPSSQRVSSYDRTPSATPSSSKFTEKPVQNNKEVSKAPAKKVKDVSYDYAYYDSNVGGDQDYQIDLTEIKKSTVKA